MDGLGGPMDGFGGPVHGLSIFYFFYSIDRGGQVTTSENRSFYRDLGSEAVAKNTSVNRRLD